MRRGLRYTQELLRGLKMDVTPLFLSRKCSKRSLYHVGKRGNLLRPIVSAETAGKPPKTVKPQNQKKWFVGSFLFYTQNIYAKNHCYWCINKENRPKMCKYQSVNTPLRQFYYTWHRRSLIIGTRLKTQEHKMLFSYWTFLKRRIISAFYF